MDTFEVIAKDNRTYDADGTVNVLTKDKVYRVYSVLQDAKGRVSFLIWGDSNNWYAALCEYFYLP